MIHYLVMLSKEDCAALAKRLKAGKVEEVMERLEALVREGKAVRG